MSNYAKLLDFANGIFAIADWPEGGDIDGFELQDLAQKHGLLVPVIVHAPCGEECNCQEFGCYTDEEWQEGVKCLRKADWLSESEAENYQRPELTEADKQAAAEDVKKLMRKYGMGNVPKIIGALALENIRLVKEVNEHRATLGIEILPIFEV